MARFFGWPNDSITGCTSPYASYIGVQCGLLCGSRLVAGARAGEQLGHELGVAELNEGAEQSAAENVACMVLVVAEQRCRLRYVRIDHLRYLTATLQILL